MRRAVNSITKTGAALALLFIALVWLFPDGALHEILNGIFITVAIVVTLVFRKLALETVLGRGEYRRAQRMALGLTLLWVAFNLRTLQSILYRATDDAQWVLNMPTGALVTYLAIIGGYLQATSPGFKMEPGYIHGQSTGWLVLAGAVGVLIGGGVIWLQRSSSLAHWLASLF